MPPTAASGPAILASTNNDGTSVSWMEANWMFIAAAGALVGLGVLVVRISRRDPYWYGWLALVMYLLHQTEEHAYDFRGWRYAFVPNLNDSVGKLLFSSVCTPGMPACPCDPKITLYINTIMIWVGFAGCMTAAHLHPERFLLAGSLSWGTALFNGLFGHVIPAVAGFAYNPGLVQSVVMVPLGIFIVRASSRPWLCVANGLGAHVIGLGMGINVLYRAHLPEAPTMIFFNMLGGLALPLGLSWCIRHPADAYKYEVL